MGLPVHKTTRTPAPVATTFPTFVVNSGTIRRLIIDFFDPESRSRGKPFGQHGAEIRWMISAEPIINILDLLHSSFDTHTPVTLEFTGDQHDKTVYLALCRENTRGVKGPWSEIVSAIVP
jgi:hypothetical protein